MATLPIRDFYPFNFGEAGRLIQSRFMHPSDSLMVRVQPCSL